MEQLRIELSEDRQWQNKVYGGNGENLHTSETYTRKADAERGFDDLADAIILIQYKRGKLKSTLERLGLLIDK